MSDDSTDQRPDSPEQRREEVDRTGIIGVGATQPILRHERLDPTAETAAPGADVTTPPAEAAIAGPAGQQGWFSEFEGEHPTDGPGVPARADAVWGSDRADALAEEAHRARYTGPVAPEAATDPGATPAPEAPGDRAFAEGPVASPYAYPGDLPSGASEGLTSPPTGSPYVGPAPVPGSAISATGSDWPAPVATAPPRRRRRGLAIAGILALCLASGAVGGVAGLLVEDRVNNRGLTLPEPGPGVTERPAGSVANIAAQVLPSVVTIKVDAGSDGQGTGSGFVLDDRGHVLTNNHVIAAAAEGGVIQVVLSNGDSEDATIVGRDESYDLAVLKIKRTDLTPLRLGASAQVVVGDPVIAVGAPLGLDQTVTVGIVSALNRPVTPGEGNEGSYINAIQTDAAINPGNSGGPLLDLQGQVIGINSAIARVPGTGSATGGNIGLGFAIPSDQARRTAEQLITTGKATHPIIGVLLDRTFTGEGAKVRDASDAVTPEGPAAKAGVKPGDVIVSFEGKPVRTPDQLVVSIRSRAVGDSVKLGIERDGQEVELQMKLEANPDE